MKDHTSHVLVIEHRKLEVLEKTAEEIFGSTGNRVRFCSYGALVKE